jgi:hypothetical protein
MGFRKKVTDKFFCSFNHPTVFEHWLIYKGNKDFLTVGWVYENKFIYAGKVPNTPQADQDFFNVPDDFSDTDKRIAKDENINFRKNKVSNTEKKEADPQAEFHKIEDYGKALVTIFESKMQLKMGGDSLKILFPKIKFNKKSPDFRNEYILSINENGLKEVTFYTTKKDKKPLYEVIFEFENADTVLYLAEMMFPNVQHPILEKHWVLSIDEKMDNGNYDVSTAWVSENRLIIAFNLPGSELEEAESFKFSDDFINGYNKKESTNASTDENSDTDNNVATSLTVNNLIFAAINDFTDQKTDLMPNKKEEYDASNFVTLSQEQAIIRKSAAGNWRLEVRFPSYSTSDDAKETLENTVKYYQNLEGLEYRLVKKSDATTANGRTYIWDIHHLDDAETGVILKWQAYPMSNGQFGLKMELGK